ncbi:hypothetical protein WN943_026122 [Citrus x changshan-huyou]
MYDSQVPSMQLEGKKIQLPRLLFPMLIRSMINSYKLWKDGKGMKLMDPSLDDTHSSWKLLTCLQIALLCVQENPNDRPSMLEVYSMLENENTADIMTPKKLETFSKKAYEDEQLIYASSWQAASDCCSCLICLLKNKWLS